MRSTWEDHPKKGSWSTEQNMLYTSSGAHKELSNRRADAAQASSGSCFLRSSDRGVAGLPEALQSSL